MSASKGNGPEKQTAGEQVDHAATGGPRRKMKKQVSVDEQTIPEEDVIAPLKPGRHRGISESRTSSLPSIRRPQFAPNKAKPPPKPKRLTRIPPLHLAAERGESEKVRRLLSRGTSSEGTSVSINVSAHDPEDEGNTALHVAARAGHMEVCNVLLEYGAKIESRNKYGDTCLHTAASHGQIRIVRFFLDRDIKVEMRGHHQFTALHSAAKNGQPSTCKYLILEGGANINAKTVRGDSPLHIAAYMGETGAMKMLLRMGASVEPRNKMLETPLHRCCASGQTEAVRLLILRKAELDVRQKYGWTLLHTAASNGHTEIVKLLLDNRADINAQDYSGNTPLHVASFFGKNVVVQMLLDKFADIEAKDSHGRTPLHHAAWCGMREPRGQVQVDNSSLPLWYGYARNGEAISSVWQDKSQAIGGAMGLSPRVYELAPSNVLVVRSLLTKKANYLAKSIHQETPLHFAATTGQLETCKLLLKSGARLEDRAAGGRSLLHLVACGCGQVDVGTLLLDRHCSVDPKNKFGDTPLALACKFGKMDFAMLLLQRGANANLLNTKPGEQNAPIHNAAECGHVDVVKMLLSLSVDRQKVVNVNNINGAGDTALIKAAAAGNHGVAWLLLTSGASVEHQRSLLNKKRTALHTAAEHGHTDVVRLLADNKADIAATDLDGQTALHVAAATGHIAVCRMLISDYKAEVQKVDNLGRTPLHLAAQYGHYSVVSMLLNETEADCESRDVNGNIPLHCAADRFTANDNDLKTIKVFLENTKTAPHISRMLRARNNHGETPIVRMRNVANKSVHFVELLRILTSKM